MNQTGPNYKALDQSGHETKQMALKNLEKGLGSSSKDLEFHEAIDANRD